MKQAILKAHRQLKRAGNLEAEKEAILEAERVVQGALVELGHALKVVGIASDPARQEVGRLFRKLGEGALPDLEIPLGELLRAVEYEELEKKVQERLDRALDEGKMDSDGLRELAELRLLQASTHTLLALSFLLGARREAEDRGQVREKLLRALEWTFIALEEACDHKGIAGLQVRIPPVAPGEGAG